MKRALNKILRVGVIAVGFVVLAVIAAMLLLFFDKPLTRNLLREQIEKRTGMTVRIGKLDYRLFPLRIKVEELVLGQENAAQKLSVSLARLAIEGDLRKVLGRKKPAVGTVEADGVVFRLEMKTVSKEPLDFKALASRAADALSWAERVSLRNARLSGSLLFGETGRGDFDLSLTADISGGIIAYRIDRGEFDVADGSRGIGLKGGSISSGTIRLVPSVVLEAGIALGPLTVVAPNIGGPLNDVTIEGKGRFDSTAEEVALSRLKIAVPGLVEIEGTARGTVAPSASFETEATIRVEKLENLFTLLEPKMPAELRGAGLRGRAHLSGRYQMTRTGKDMQDRISAVVALEDVGLDHEFSGVPVHAGISGRVNVDGPTNAPRFSANVRSSIGRMTWKGLAVGDSEVHIVAAGTKETVDISRFDASLKGLDLETAAGKKVSFDKVSLSGRARLDLERMAVTLTSLESRLPGLSPILATGRFGLAKGGPVELKIQSRSLEIPALRALAAPFLPTTLSGWDFGGTADLALEARGPDASGSGLAFKGTFSLAQAKFNDPSFTIAGEGLDPAMNFDGTYAPSKGLAFTGALNISAGESLWKSVYVSWKTHPLRLTFAGLYGPDSGRVDDLAVRFEVPTIGDVRITGSAGTRPSPVFDLRSQARLSLSPLLSLVAQTGETPEGRMKLEGTLEADVQVRSAKDALAVKGRLSLADVTLELPLSGTLISGVAADIPVHIELEEKGPAPKDGPILETGSVRIGAFKSSFLSLGPIEASLRGGANAYEIEPIALDLFGGSLELGRTTVRIDPRARTFRGTSSLALREIDISLIPVPSPGFKLTGKVRGEFPRLDISAAEIAVSGRAEADVFGGQVVLRDLAVSEPFTPGRSISLDVDLIDLDLKKLTDEVPFGEVTGIISGGIRGLVISYGQPERFDLRIDSVPRRGVSRTFSLKAVDNLTILSSGEQASAGTAPFWTRFIRGFRYEKLGIVSTLRNDTFTLNGTIREGGVEYLVKKPPLFGINVVNRRPDNVISFREMTSRLKRIGRSEK